MFIIKLRLTVRLPIQFNYKTFFKTTEVHDKIIYSDLATKFVLS